MGADFLFACLPACDLTPERRLAALKAARAAVRAMDQDELDWFAPDATKSQVLTRLRGRLVEYRELKHRRDVALIALDGAVTCWLTGGLSWGDPPTDSYTVLGELEQAGLWDLFTAWEQADHALRLAQNAIAD